MKVKAGWFGVLVAAVVSLSSQAAIFEIKNMRDAVEGVGKNTLVVFDIDNTILQTAQTLGSVQWADWYQRELVKQGLPSDQAGELSTREWVRINRVSKSQLVEAVTPNIIRNLQLRGIRVLALTARPVSFVLQTQRDLPQFGIHFGQSWPKGTRFQSPFQGAAYASGVLFAGQTNSKGAVIREFLRQNNLRPTAIRFVDDKRKYVDSVDQAMQAAGIPYVGYRYGGADVRVNSFSPSLAAFTHSYFKRMGIILSDAQARRLMGGTGRAALP